MVKLHSGVRGLLALLGVVTFATAAQAQYITGPVGPGQTSSSSGGGVTCTGCSASDLTTYLTSSTFGHITPGTGVATALGNTAGGTGGFALQSGLAGAMTTSGSNATAAALQALVTAAGTASTTLGGNLFIGGGHYAVYSSGNSGGAGLGNNGVELGASATVHWGTGGPFNQAYDLYLSRDAAGILAQLNGTNAQSFRVYNTYTDASNNEYGAMSWQETANVLAIATKAKGTGIVRNISIRPGGTEALNLAPTTLLATFAAGIKAAALSTSATVAGSVCAASDGTLIYKVGVNCF